MSNTAASLGESQDPEKAGQINSASTELDFSIWELFMAMARAWKAFLVLVVALPLVWLSVSALLVTPQFELRRSYLIEKFKYVDLVALNNRKQLFTDSSMADLFNNDGENSSSARETFQIQFSTEPTLQVGKGYSQVVLNANLSSSHPEALARGLPYLEKFLLEPFFSKLKVQESIQVTQQQLEAGRRKFGNELLMLRRENEVLAKVISALKQLASVDTAQKTQIIIGDSGSGARYLPVSQQQLGAQSKRIENQVRIEQLQTVTELNERLSDFLELFSSKLQTAAGPELRDLLNRADPEIRAHDPVLFQIIESTIFGDTPSYGVLTTISEPTQVTPRLRVELLKAVSAGLILFFLLVIVSKALAILRVRAH